MISVLTLNINWGWVFSRNVIICHSFFRFYGLVFVKNIKAYFPGDLYRFSYYFLLYLAACFRKNGVFVPKNVVHSILKIDF